MKFKKCFIALLLFCSMGAVFLLSSFSLNSISVQNEFEGENVNKLNNKVGFFFNNAVFLENSKSLFRLSEYSMGDVVLSVAIIHTSDDKYILEWEYYQYSQQIYLDDYKNFIYSCFILEFVESGLDSTIRPKISLYNDSPILLDSLDRDLVINTLLNDNNTMSLSDVRVINFPQTYESLLDNSYLLEYNPQYLTCVVTSNLTSNSDLLQYLFDVSYNVRRAMANSYYLGFQNGYLTSPQYQQSALENFWSIIHSVFAGVGDILSIEILPGFSIGVIIFVPITIGLVGFILWIWRRR